MRIVLAKPAQPANAANRNRHTRRSPQQKKDRQQMRIVLATPAQPANAANRNDIAASKCNFPQPRDAPLSRRSPAPPRARGRPAGVAKAGTRWQWRQGRRQKKRDFPIAWRCNRGEKNFSPREAPELLPHRAICECPSCNFVALAMCGIGAAWARKLQVAE